MDLYVRASRNDHTVIDHFLTPSTVGTFARVRQPIGAVVADATVAIERPKLATYSSDAGIPYLVDPVTPLLQSEQAPDDKWAGLPFAHPEPLAVADLSDYVLDELVDRTITFQREAGATHLIPPYFYSNKREDAWWQANLALLHRSAGYLSRNGIDLPVIPVLAANLREYGREGVWERGLDRYLSATRDLNTETVALSWSWNDPAKSKDAALALLLGATAHAAQRAPVIGWRAGAYGHAMAAAGAGGYETGIGARESLHYVRLFGSKKPRPRPENNQPRPPAFVYMTEFGRSIVRRAARVLLEDPRVAGSLVCNPDNSCCSDGVNSMIAHWREHTIRERARELNQLEVMPPAIAWRMHEVEQKAARAHNLAVVSNEILTSAGADIRLPADTFASLHRVASAIRSGARRQAA